MSGQWEVTSIAPCNGDWFLIHHIDDKKQTIWPVAAWGIVNGKVTGLIGVLSDEGHLVGPPPGKKSYKTREELNQGQIRALSTGGVYVKGEEETN
jgi:hypothetical protein